MIDAWKIGIAFAVLVLVISTSIALARARREVKEDGLEHEHREEQ